MMMQQMKTKPVLQRMVQENDVELQLANTQSANQATYPQSIGRLVEANGGLLYRTTKRTFDVLVSAVGIIALSPLLLLTALAIKIEDPKGRVLYVAPRGGLNGLAFDCLKFRSMYSNADEIKDSLMAQNEMSGPVFKIKNDPRVTKVGRFIRKTSIDELPQLFNVFAGQMSFVGPRPLPIAEENAVEGIYKVRELVKPGITCIWQVSGRNSIDFDDWMKLDMEYVQKRTILFDLELLLKTIPAVLSNRGAS